MREETLIGAGEKRYALLHSKFVDFETASETVFPSAGRLAIRLPDGSFTARSLGVVHGPISGAEIYK